MRISNYLAYGHGGTVTKGSVSLDDETEDY